MKSRLYAITAIVCLALAIAPAARGASMAIGYLTWFNWWETQEDYIEKFYDKYSYEVDPSFLYGPMLSFQITPEWNVSSLFIMGSYKTKFSGVYEGEKYSNSYDIWRYDSDTTASYAFTPFFTVYFGFKFMRYTYTIEDSSDTGDGMTYIYNDYAPGIGVIFTIELVKNMYLSISLGSIFSFTEVTVENIPDDTIVILLDEKSYKAGANARIALNYDIEKIHMVVSLGFRYQMLYGFFEKIKDIDQTHHLYGPLASVTFYFDI